MSYREQKRQKTKLYVWVLKTKYLDVKRITGEREVRGVDWVPLSAKLEKKTNDRLGAIEVIFMICFDL